MPLFCHRHLIADDPTLPSLTNYQKKQISFRNGIRAPVGNSSVKSSSSVTARVGMLFIARGGCRGRRRVRCLGDDRDLHPVLPSIALTNNNRCPIALELLGTAGLALKSYIPFPVPPHLVASRTYQRRILSSLPMSSTPEEHCSRF